MVGLGVDGAGEVFLDDGTVHPGAVARDRRYAWLAGEPGAVTALRR